MIRKCRECGQDASTEAFVCPHCGAPYPTRVRWTGWGWEYRSEACILGLPLLHVSFKYGPNRLPVPARGVIAIGQFAVGIVTIAQFGLGLFSLSQFTIAGWAVAQFAAGWSGLAQIGVWLHQGRGQIAIDLGALVQKILGS